MGFRNLPGDEREALESFKRALQDEYGRKLEALEERFEKEFSALIATRRIEVETKVQRIREKQAVEFEKELAMARQSAFRELRTRVLSTISEITDRLEERVVERVKSLRSNREIYGPVLNDLAREALDALGSPKAILRVGEGEAVLLEEDPRIARIEETADLAMGGVMALDAEGGTHLVDNSLRTRWERLKPMMVENLSGRLAGLVSDVQEPLTELRLS
jgi:vacuolar-type H+-ATPase subunit E/Vma4